MKIYSPIRDGKLHPSARDALLSVLNSMEGKTVEIEVKQKKRSLSQNRYRFGVVMETIRSIINNELREQGLPECSIQDIDLFVKENALGIVHKIPTKYGDIMLQGRLKEKTISEFEESMEAIRAWAAQKGIIVPLPRESLEE